MPSGCDLAQLPQSSLAGVLCAIATIQGTLNGPPQPECAARCHCSLQAPLGRVSSLVDAAQGAKAKKCKRDLDSARRAAKSFDTRVGSLAKRHCIAPSDVSAALVQEMGDLTNRSKALFKSGYCAGR
jgi:hypothetical protein